MMTKKSSKNSGSTGSGASVESRTTLNNPPVQSKDINATSTSYHTGAKTRITVKFDVGFNNSLSIRGKGANLSWDKGVPLRNIKADEWIWETDSTFPPGEFKILINDRIYETGQNHTLTCGSHIQYTPHF